MDLRLTPEMEAFRDEVRSFLAHHRDHYAGDAGARPREASRVLIRESIRTAMIPTIDSMKTLGIVQLPGMMTGLILAGTSPELAIKYQIMVMFMLTGAVTISGFVASFWAYRSFFTDKAQLVGE